MAHKLSRIIDTLSYEDLLKLRKDVQSGAVEFLVEQRIQSLSPTLSKACPVCNAQVSEQDHITLIFGPGSFKQKASFDGVDCLQYFLERIKQKEQKSEDSLFNKKGI